MVNLLIFQVYKSRWSLKIKKAYKTLLFDLDDTLLDIVNAEHLSLKLIHNNYYNQIEFNEFKQLYQSINRSLWDSLGQSGSDLKPRDIKIKRFVQLNHGLQLDTDVSIVANTYEESIGKHSDWIPGAKNAIEFLHQQGYALGIVTNGITSLQYLKYERHLLNSWFNCYIISDEVGVSKPNKEIFTLAFSQLALNSNLTEHPDANTTLFIGDSLISDGGGAMNCGMDFCLINPQGISLDGCKIPVKYNIHGVSKLPSCLGHSDYENNKL